MKIEELRKELLKKKDNYIKLRNKASLKLSVNEAMYYDGKIETINEIIMLLDKGGCDII